MHNLEIEQGTLSVVLSKIISKVVENKLGIPCKIDMNRLVVKEHEGKTIVTLEASVSVNTLDIPSIVTNLDLI